MKFTTEYPKIRIINRVRQNKIVLLGYETYQLIASGVFDLNKTQSGKCVNTLTQLNQLRFAVGGNFKEKSFGAQLTSEKIETDTFILENFVFGLKNSSRDVYCIANGTFIFKLEGNRIGFTLSGAVSNKLFIISAASLPGSRIPLNSRLSFSDLALSIGVNGGKVSFGMTGRLNANHLSIFAGFAVSPPRITLFTATLTVKYRTHIAERSGGRDSRYPRGFSQLP